MKAWEVTIVASPVLTGRFHYCLDSETLSFVVVGGNYYKTHKSACAAARRVMKRLGLVEKAKAGK